MYDLEGLSVGVIMISFQARHCMFPRYKVDCSPMGPADGHFSFDGDALGTFVSDMHDASTRVSFG